MKHQVTRLLQGTALAVAIVLGSDVIFAAEKVTIAEFKYPGAQAKVNLLKHIIQDRLGLEVATATGDHAMFYAGMDRGKGDIDVHVSVWQPNQINFKKEYVDKKGTVVYSEKYHKGTTGFCINRKFAEKHNVKSVFDLARPEVAKLLVDSNGNGKGDIWVGKSGWAATAELTVKLRDYGLLAFNEPTESDNAVNMAAIADAIRKDKGRVFYCWRPSLVWIQFDILELEEPAYDPSCHNMISPAEDPEWYEKSKVSCASEERKVYIAWSKALEERLPVVTHLLGNIQLTAEMVSAWAYEIGGKNRDPGEVMKEWIAANKETVDKWLGM